jgi:hypothetical protein
VSPWGCSHVWLQSSWAPTGVWGPDPSSLAGHGFSVMLEVEPRAWCILGKCSTTEIHPSPGFFETESHYVAQVGLEIRILLPLVLECWGYSHHTWLQADLLNCDPKCDMPLFQPYFIDEPWYNIGGSLPSLKCQEVGTLGTILEASYRGRDLCIKHKHVKLFQVVILLACKGLLNCLMNEFQKTLMKLGSY